MSEVSSGAGTLLSNHLRTSKRSIMLRRMPAYECAWYTWQKWTGCSTFSQHWSFNETYPGFHHSVIWWQPTSGCQEKAARTHIHNNLQANRHCISQHVSSGDTMYNPCCQQLYNQAQVLTLQLWHNTLPPVVANQPAQVAYQRTYQENHESLNPLPAACTSTLGIKRHHMVAASVEYMQATLCTSDNQCQLQLGGGRMALTTPPAAGTCCVTPQCMPRTSILHLQLTQRQQMGNSIHHAVIVRS